jgi:26S proteasome regulatory subunit N6
VEWATAEKRTFLRQRIEARLVALQLQSRNFTAALALIGKLLTEVDTQPRNVQKRNGAI